MTTLCILFVQISSAVACCCFNGEIGKCGMDFENAVSVEKEVKGRVSGEVGET